MFSKTCEYGIRAVIYIAGESAKGKFAGIDDIIKAIDAPKPFTAKILQNLSHLGLIQSQKGRNGGFYLDKKRELKLIDIVTAIDGDHIFNGCGLGIAECSEDKPCPLHHHFVKIRNELKEVMEKTTVQKLTSGLERNLTFLKK